MRRPPPEEGWFGPEAEGGSVLGLVRDVAPPLKDAARQLEAAQGLP